METSELAEQIIEILLDNVTCEHDEDREEKHTSVEYDIPESAKIKIEALIIENIFK